MNLSVRNVSQIGRQNEFDGVFWGRWQNPAENFVAHAATGRFLLSHPAPVSESLIFSQIPVTLVRCHAGG